MARDAPEEYIAAKSPQAHVEDAKKGVVQGFQGTLESEKNVTLHGYPGQEYTISTGGGGAVKGRSFLVGRRIYTLTVIYSPSIGTSKADEFLTSFQLVNPPPPIKPKG